MRWPNRNMFRRQTARSVTVLRNYREGKSDGVVSYTANVSCPCRLRFICTQADADLEARVVPLRSTSLYLNTGAGNPRCALTDLRALVHCCDRTNSFLMPRDPFSLTQFVRMGPEVPLSARAGAIRMRIAYRVFVGITPAVAYRRTLKSGCNCRIQPRTFPSSLVLSLESPVTPVRNFSISDMAELPFLVVTESSDKLNFRL